MSFSVIASLPIGFSSLFLLVEVHTRYISNRRQQIAYFSHYWYVVINITLWLCCIASSVVALETKFEAASVTSFQLAWMQAAILKIYQLRMLLFQSPESPQTLGVLGLTFTVGLQSVAAGLCIWDAASSSSSHWRRHSLVPILHLSWGLYYIVLLVWISAFISIGGTNFEHLREWRTCCFILAPLLVSAVVGAIPLSWWYPPIFTFLGFCALQSFLYIATAALHALTGAPASQLGARYPRDEVGPSWNGSIGESDRNLVLETRVNDSGAASSKENIEC